MHIHDFKDSEKIYRTQPHRETEGHAYTDSEFNIDQKYTLFIECYKSFE